MDISRLLGPFPSVREQFSGDVDRKPPPLCQSTGIISGLDGRWCSLLEELWIASALQARQWLGRPLLRSALRMTRLARCGSGRA